MNPFSYHNPTRIEFGPDKENNIGQWLREDGIENVLLVYGTGSIKRNGLYERVIDSLKSSNIKYDELSDVISNPVLSKVNEGIQLARSSNAQAILAVGGGSVIDTAKAVAAGTQFDGDIWECYLGKSQIQ